MTSNLDRSLDEILAARPKGGRRGGRGGATPTGPAGGVSKRPQRAAAKKATAAVAANAPKSKPTVNSTKIIVSNLPYDVSEQMIKEYFQQVVGPIRRAIITYGPDGRSRGIASVEFNKPEHAATAAQKYNGVEVDKRPMKVELVVDPNAKPTFAERIGAPNPIPKGRQEKPKPVAKSAPRGGARGGRGGRGRGGLNGTRKPKTAEELDQEMEDYYSTNASAPAAAAPAAPAANGDAMEDDGVL